MTQDFADFKAPGNKPILNSIFDVSDNFLGELRLWLEQNPPAIGISSILGFAQFTAKSAQVAANETTTSTTYSDLATGGPTLSGLPDGSYVILHGCKARNTTAGLAAFQSVSINGATAADSDECGVNYTDFISVSVALVKSLSNKGSNTVQCKYRANGGGTAGFDARWLIALRFANS